jgi:hypothetical protein
LVLIAFRLARVTRAGGSPAEAPGTRAAGRPAFPIPGGASGSRRPPTERTGAVALLDRKPYLLRPLAAQLLPPPLRAIDPAERLGIDPAPLRTVEDVRKVSARVWTAIWRSEIAPVEGARIARRLRARLRVLRRFARLGKGHAAFAADEEEVAPLEEFARDEGEYLRPLGADGATGVIDEHEVAIGQERAALTLKPRRPQAARMARAQNAR